MNLISSKLIILPLLLCILTVIITGCGQAAGDTSTATMGAGTTSATTNTSNPTNTITTATSHPIVSGTTTTTTATIDYSSLPTTTIPGHTISIQDAKALLDTGKIVVFIDVRNQTTFDTNHILGAVLIPYADIKNRLSEIPKDKEVIFYSQCNCPTDHLATGAVQIVLDNGYSNVMELTGGFNTWLQAGYATNIVLPDTLFTKVTGSFTLIPNATSGKLLPNGVTTEIAC
jgi:rhodanese-related sulfurtransferase